MDNTVVEARKESATVITSTKLGKGASMKDGALVAKPLLSILNPNFQQPLSGMIAGKRSFFRKM